MKITRRLSATILMLIAVEGSVSRLSVLYGSSGMDSVWPVFGRDTVLVWKIENQGEESSFVVRIAEFLPNRYIEWETTTTQGTIYMTQKAVRDAKIYVSARLFEGGMDTKGKDSTTLWLSQSAFRDLKARKKIKIALDAVDGWMEVIGMDDLLLDVNRSPAKLPVVKIKDDRGQERWFLDSEDNPLMVRHSFRQFSQTLKSVTTDRSNTLRWIKGRKLTNPHP